MPGKIMGADLKAGDIFKHPVHNRIYEILDIKAGADGARLTECRATNGKIFLIITFTDSEYELRTKAGRPRTRMVKVATADIQMVLDAGVGPGAGEALDRLREAIK